MDDVLKAGVDPFVARKYELTVVFADLRGFTSMSSSRSAEEVKHLIDEYLTVQIDVILGDGATIDKIVGDEVMALFGAPLPVADHALWAVNTALKMQAGHARLMAIWRNRNLTGCPLGIGVNSGEMVVGNIGSHKRMDYTVLGHNVNLAARLCSAAEPGEILLSLASFNAVRETLQQKPDAMWCPVKFRRGRTVQAKGIAQPVETVVVVPT
jgi:adenylate cyclase